MDFEPEEQPLQIRGLEGFILTPKEIKEKELAEEKAREKRFAEVLPEPVNEEDRFNLFLKRSGIAVLSDAEAEANRLAHKEALRRAYNKDPLSPDSQKAASERKTIPLSELEAEEAADLKNLGLSPSQSTGLSESTDETTRRKTKQELAIEEDRQALRNKLEKYTTEITLPDGQVIYERTWPFRQLYRVDSDTGRKIYLAPEAAQKEIQIKKGQQDRIELAVRTGNMNFIRTDDQLTQKDILRIAEAAADRVFLAEKSAQYEEEQAERLRQQRNRELNTGQLGQIYDPAFTLEYARRLLGTQAEQRLAAYEESLRLKADREHNSQKFQELREEERKKATSSESEQGVLSKIKKLFS